jgi:hypothetical protein
VAYTDSGDGVRKAVTWREKAVDVRVRDAGTSYRKTPDGEYDSDAAKFVGDAFDGMSDQGVREAGAGVNNLDAKAYEHLEDLGYV